MPTVLIVDDDADFREALEEALRGAGFEVCSAGDADEACRVASERRVDVVVSDIRMPGDGATLPRRLAQPVILMTAFEEPGIRERALWDGVVAYLNKPVSLIELRRHIATALARSAGGGAPVSGMGRSE